MCSREFSSSPYKSLVLHDTAGVENCRRGKLLSGVDGRENNMFVVPLSTQPRVKLPKLGELLDN